MSTSENHNFSISDVAVIIAARNEEETIQVCVESVILAARGQAEIWVVDDGSTDQTLEILRGFGSKIRVIRETGKGPGHARNVAVGQTERKYVAFTDADAKVAPDWLEKLIAGLHGKTINHAAVGGPQKISSSAGETEKEIGRFLEAISFVSDYIHTESNVREVAHNPTCNALYSKAALNAVGGFDETLWPTEDLDLDLRLKESGFKLLFTPLAIVEHRRPATYRGFLKMMRRYGFAHAQLVKKRGVCQPIHYLPFFPFIVPFLPIFFMPVLKRPWFAILFFEVLVSWLFGFYSGLMNPRKIAHV